VGEDSPSCAPSPGGPGSYEPDPVGFHFVGEQREPLARRRVDPAGLRLSTGPSLFRNLLPVVFNGFL
jgi:hypothetical protein